MYKNTAHQAGVKTVSSIYVITSGASTAPVLDNTYMASKGETLGRVAVRQLL